jgi:hypothetical protein
MVESSHETDRLAEPEPDAVRTALEHALESDAFRSAPQLSAFLSFVVERSLEGRSSELKGYTIAVEAFGRPADFDPQADPIVRVEAGRLRKALSQYYQGDGAGEAIRISMPVGGYAPVFEQLSQPARDAVQGKAPAQGHDPARDSEPEVESAPFSGTAPVRPPARPAAPQRARLGARHWLGVFCLALVLLPLATWHRDMPAEQAPIRDPATQQTRLSEQATRLSGTTVPTHLPMIAVSISKTGDDPVLDEVLRAFTRLLVDAVARFDDLVTVKAPEGGGDPLDGVDYVFEMNATRQGGATEGLGRLRSTKDRRIVWTTSAIRTLTKGAEDPELSEIARRLAIRLAEPFGIIHADYRQSSPPSPMRCIFLALNFRRTMKAEDHLAARTCLDGVIEKDPAFPPAWSHLALLTLEEHISGFNPLPGSPLDRALSAALTAVRLAPSSARAQQAMMDVYFARGALEDAFKAGQEALSRNPYDPDIMADLGAHYVQVDRPAEGLPLLQRAVELSSGRPSWYDFYAFLAAHLMGNDKLAETHAAILVADENPLSLIGRSLQFVRKGDEQGAATTLRRLAQMAPAFALDPRQYLSRKGFGAAVADRIIADIGVSRIEASRAH